MFSARTAEGDAGAPRRARHVGLEPAHRTLRLGLAPGRRSAVNNWPSIVEHHRPPLVTISQSARSMPKKPRRSHVPWRARPGIADAEQRRSPGARGCSAPSCIPRSWPGCCRRSGRLSRLPSSSRQTQPIASGARPICVDVPMSVGAGAVSSRGSRERTRRIASLPSAPQRRIASAPSTTPPSDERAEQRAARAGSTTRPG